MRVFVTGATGFIGSRIVRELIQNGHAVLGLVRSQDKAEALAGAGGEPLVGSIEDDAVLARGAAAADGVIHTAFNHDFSTYVANCEDDRRVIAALASGLAGSDRPMLVTSGMGLGSGDPGRPYTERDPAPPASVSPRAATDEAAAQARAAGANVGVVRLPQVHDTRRQGLISYEIDLARQKGAAAYVGDGRNRWSAAHVTDVARLYRLALERGEPGAVWHAVAEGGVERRAIAEAIGRRLGLPVRSIAAQEAGAHFGWLAGFAAQDVPVSSDVTRAALGWQPTGPGLIADLETPEPAAG